MLTALSRAVLAGALLAGSVKAGDHFIISQCRELSYTRIDPLRTPGSVGPHVHNVVGGSMFGPDSTTPEILQQSKCSSTMLQDDKSIYWTPLLYYNHGNGSYSPMISSTRIYYFLKPGNGTTPVVPFPKGFRMLGGGYSDSRPQTYPPRGQLSYDQKQALDPRINAIMWGCSAGAVQGQGSGGSLPGQRPYLPNDAPNGCGVVNAGMFFPSCGDGRLDSDDHFSHMTYPLDDSNGYNCPPSHPIKYPTIFIEHFYFPSADQPYRGANTDNWILANGDPTGLNMHGDFINGWNQDTLTQTLQQCNTPNAPEENLQACAPLAKSLSVDAANTCLSEGNIADEDVGLGAPITGFPGCNPYWGWESRTKPTCGATPNVGLVQPSGRYTVEDFKLNLPVANGTSKSVTGPAGANSTDYDYNYSSSYASTATSYTAPTSTDASASTATGIASAATETASVTEAASATETASSYTSTPTGEVKSEDPTLATAATSSEAIASPTSTASSEVTPPSVTSTSSYDFGNPSGPTDSSTAAVPTQTTSSDAPAQATSTGAPSVASTSSYDFGNPSNPTDSSTAAVPAQTTSSDAPAQATSTGAPAQVTSTGAPAQVNSSGAAVETTPTRAAAQATPSATTSSVPYYDPAVSSPSSSASTSPANATPVSQNSNPLNPGNDNGKPKTCRRKSHRARSGSHARRHRESQRRSIH